MEVVPVMSKMEIYLKGTKDPLLEQPWIVHSPFALLTIDALDDIFPTMRLLWVHRALSQCLSSLCSSLAIHESIYTGRKPTETKLAMTGSKIIGMFGSGSENAIDYLANFDIGRMAHWSNRDANRSCARLVGFTMQYFGMEMDRYRRIQAINGQTEYAGLRRPQHDCALSYFGLDEGHVAEAFKSYIHQFPELAYEPKFGVKLSNVDSLFQAAEKIKLAAPDDPTKIPNLPAGHYLKPGSESM
jgi:hypothetical protein